MDKKRELVRMMDKSTGRLDILTVSETKLKGKAELDVEGKKGYNHEEKEQIVV